MMFHRVKFTCPLAMIIILWQNCVDNQKTNLMFQKLSLIHTSTSNDHSLAKMQAHLPLIAGWFCLSKFRLQILCRHTCLPTKPICQLCTKRVHMGLAQNTLSGWTLMKIEIQLGKTGTTPIISVPYELALWTKWCTFHLKKHHCFKLLNAILFHGAFDF
jgi:hypothetical protein